MIGPFVGRGKAKAKIDDRNLLGTSRFSCETTRHACSNPPERARELNRHVDGEADQKGKGSRMLPGPEIGAMQDESEGDVSSNAEGYAEDNNLAQHGERRRLGGIHGPEKQWCLIARHESGPLGIHSKTGRRWDGPMIKALDFSRFQFRLR